MKRILLLAIAALWLAAPSSSQAQSVTKLCFPATGLTATRTSCIPVDSSNPLPTSATVSIGSSINVTPNNTAAAPLFVTNPNGFGGTSVTVNNATIAGAVAVTCANCGAASVTGPFNVTITNTTSAPAVITGTALGDPSDAAATAGSTGSLMAKLRLMTTQLDTINTSINAPGNVSILNTTSATAIVATVQNANASAPVFMQQVPGTTNGWQTALLNGLTTTVTTVKNGTGNLAKLYCYNPNSSVAYVQVFSLTPTMVTLGTTTPTNSYGIAATNTGGFAQPLGDGYSNAISVAATTTVKGLTAPSTAIDCNVSFN